MAFMEQYEYNDYLKTLDIDPIFIENGLLEAKNRGLNKIRIKPLNHYEKYGFSNSKELYNFKLDTVYFEKYNLIKSLELSDYIGLNDKDLKGLYELKTLEHLAFEHISVKPDLSNFPLLEKLYFKYNEGTKNINTLKNLQDLLIFSLKTNDCSYLEGLNELKMLRLTRGTFLSINGIENFKLKRLDINYNSKVENIDAIITLPELETLNIEKCKNIYDYSFLAGNKSIKELSIDNLDTLSFVPSMEKLEKINIWNCKDGNMEYLLKSKSLKNINCYLNKKHYTHTWEEIKKIKNIK
jgi:internalin A